MRGIVPGATQRYPVTMELTQEVSAWTDRGMDSPKSRLSHRRRRSGSTLDAAPFDVDQFRRGMEVELEHGRHDPVTDVTDDDPLVTARIAWAHLKEFPDYYDRLERMEAEAEAERSTA